MMPHKCTKCKKVYSDKEKQIILHGCECGCKRFFYIAHGKIKNVEVIKEKEIVPLPKTEKKTEAAQCADDSCSAISTDNSKLNIDESLQNQISVSELEDGKYSIDIGAIIPNGKKK